MAPGTSVFSPVLGLPGDGAGGERRSALVISVAAGLEMDGDHVRSAGLALGGVALKPWRKVEAEKVLMGKPAGAETFMQAANILLQGAKGYEHNTFKIELAKQGVMRALTLASKGTTEGGQA